MCQPTPPNDVAQTYEPSQAELTSVSQFEGSLSSTLSPTTEAHQPNTQLRRSDTLTFPKLESDGSLPDLREARSRSLRYPSSPTSLSSSRVIPRIAGNMDVEGSVTSLEDSTYDMIDDLSEVSTSDGRETASIASSDRNVSDDEGEMTPEEDDGDGIDIEINTGSVGDLAGTLRCRAEQSTAEANRIMDSYMTEDLETPRQSLLHPSSSSTETTSAPTTGSGPPSSEAAEKPPINLQVLLYCLNASEGPRVAPRIGSRLAACLGSGQSGAGEVVMLPPTPDDTQGSLLCRYGNMNITIEPVDYRASNPSTILIPKRKEVDLIAMYLSDFEDAPLDFVDGVANATHRYAAWTLVITKTEAERKCMDNLYGGDMLVDEKMLFSLEQDEEMRAGLQYICRNPLTQQGWKGPSTLPKKSEDFKSALPAWVQGSPTLWRLAAGALLLAFFMPSVFTSYKLYSNWSVVGIEEQRKLLSASLQSWTNSTGDMSRTVSYILPLDRYAPPRSECIVWPPDGVVMVVVDDHGTPAKEFVGTEVVRLPNHYLTSNTTFLADGIYGIKIPAEEAYGVVQFTAVFGKPVIHAHSTHDFGRQALQRGTYIKAGADLTGAINKDITIARKAAKNLTDRIGLELTAGVAATQNVTSQLAVRMTRDMQVFAGNAVELFGKAASQSLDKVEQINKDLVIARKDLIKRADDVKKSLATTAHSIKDLIIPSKKIVTEPLKTSRDRARDFQNRFALYRWRQEVKKGELDAKGKEVLAMLEREYGEKRDDVAASKKVDKCGKCKGEGKMAGKSFR